MRILNVQISKGKGDYILQSANKFKAKNISLVKGHNTEEELEIISLSLSNNKVENFISEVTKLDGA